MEDKKIEVKTLHLGEMEQQFVKLFFQFMVRVGLLDQERARQVLAVTYLQLMLMNKDCAYALMDRDGDPEALRDEILSLVRAIKVEHIFDLEDPKEVMCHLVPAMHPTSMKDHERACQYFIGLREVELDGTEYVPGPEGHANSTPRGPVSDIATLADQKHWERALYAGLGVPKEDGVEVNTKAVHASEQYIKMHKRWQAEVAESQKPAMDAIKEEMVRDEEVEYKLLKPRSDLQDLVGKVMRSSIASRKTDPSYIAAGLKHIETHSVNNPSVNGGALSQSLSCEKPLDS